MPYKQKKQGKYTGLWVAEVMFEGKRHTTLKPTKSAARDWESAKKKELQETIPDTIFLREAAAKYLRFCELNFDPKTFAEKKKILKELGAVTGNVAVIDLAPQVLQDFIYAQKTANLCNRAKKNLGAFFQYCIDILQAISTNPTRPIKKLAHERTPQRVATEAEVVKLMLAASVFDRNLIVACATTGSRKSEVFRWTWADDVNFEERWVRSGNKKNRQGVLKYRKLPMNDVLLEALQYQWKHRLPGSDYVFQNRAEWVDKKGRVVRRHPNYGQGYTARRKFLGGLCKKAQIDPPLGFHALRRFFASILSDKHKESLPTIQRLMGHASATTTDRYIYRIRGDIREAVGKIDFKDVLQTDLQTKDGKTG